MNNLLVKYFLPIFLRSIANMTPMFRVVIIETLDRLAIEAEQTDNPLDDIIVAGLLGIMNLPEFTKNGEEK